MEQPCNQVDHIASGSAPEAVIKVRVEFEAWVAVIVERTSDHVMAGHGKPVCLGSLRHADTCFNSFKKVHNAFPPSELFGFFHPGFLYGENAGELKNEAVLGFGRSREGENCKNAIETGLWDSYMCKIKSWEQG